jgi:hypothetical protein
MTRFSKASSSFIPIPDTQDKFKTREGFLLFNYRKPKRYEIGIGGASILDSKPG